MKHKLGTSLGLIAVGAVLAGTGTAAAATGGTFLLGRDNTSAVTTVLRNTGATPNLTLPAARPGQAPLAVSASSGKVNYFNADKLDGTDSTAFALVAGKVGSVEAVSEPFDVDVDGVPDVFAAVADCPPGTKLTGGGHEALTMAGALVSAPDMNGWLVLSLPDVTTVPEEATVPADVVAIAQCYNPRGGVPGAVTSYGKRSVELDAATKAKVLELAAKR